MASKPSTLESISKKRICEMSADEYRKFIAAVRAAIDAKPKERK